MSNGKIGRNEKCPCESNKKYKKCHGSDSLINIEKASKGTLISENEANKLKKEFGDSICGRCNLYGMDIEGISKDKEKYTSELLQLQNGVYWCPPHYKELLKDIAIMTPHVVKEALGQKRYKQIMNY